MIECNKVISQTMPLQNGILVGGMSSLSLSLMPNVFPVALILAEILSGYEFSNPKVLRLVVDR